jgi:PleD family two-component response regulator
VARAVLFTADLLFGSNVQGMLVAGGHEVLLVGGPAPLRETLAQRAPETLIVDLTDEALEGTGTVSELRGEGLLDGVSVLGYYSHVEPSARDAALAVGFDLVVARSRMAREAAQLVTTLAGA